MCGDINSQIRGYGAWNNWEKEGATKEIVGRVSKKGFGTIWLEKRGCIRSKEMTRVNLSKDCQPRLAGITALKRKLLLSLLSPEPNLFIENHLMKTLSSHEYTETATRGFYKKNCSKKFHNRKTTVLESQHSCFLRNIVKFLRTPILKKICEWLLLNRNI